MSNVGGFDKTLRIILGSVLVVIALDGEHFFGQQVWWAWIGLAPLISGIVNFCPFYAFVGFSTKSMGSGSIDFK